MGTPFTIKNKNERKEVIDQINADPQISKFLTCVGLEVEQFTGKILYALLKMENKFIKFDVSGFFPNIMFFPRLWN